jgi:hypothetical protein
MIWCAIVGLDGLSSPIPSPPKQACGIALGRVPACSLKDTRREADMLDAKTTFTRRKGYDGGWAKLGKKVQCGGC